MVEEREREEKRREVFLCRCKKGNRGAGGKKRTETEWTDLCGDI